MPFVSLSKKFRKWRGRNHKKNKNKRDEEDDFIVPSPPQQAVSMYNLDQLPSGFTARVMAADRASYHLGGSMNSLVTMMEEVEERQKENLRHNKSMVFQSSSTPRRHSTPFWPDPIPLSPTPNISKINTKTPPPPAKPPRSFTSSSPSSASSSSPTETPKAPPSSPKKDPPIQPVIHTLATLEQAARQVSLEEKIRRIRDCPICSGTMEEIYYV